MAYRLTYEPGVDGGITVRGLRSRRCAALHLGPDHAALTMDGHDPVALPWKCFQRLGPRADAAALDAWSVTGYTEGRSASFGAAVFLHGGLDSDGEGIRKATGWVRRYHTWLATASHLADRTGHRVAVLTSHVHQDKAERATLDALCTVLAARYELRGRLRDVERMRQLASDLNCRQLSYPDDHGAMRGCTVGISVAVHAVFPRYQFLRPLPDEPIPTIEEMVSKVRGRISRLPGVAPGHNASDEAIRAVVQHYTSVEPWPFGALTGPA